MNGRSAADDSRGGGMRAEIRLPSRDLHADLSFYVDRLGFRLETIFPADNPAVAVVTGHGLRIRLERGAEEPPGTIRLLCEHPDRFAAGETELTGPNGTRIEILPRRPCFRAAPDPSRSGGAAAERERGVGRRPRRHAVPRPGSGTPRRGRDRLAHPHSRGRPGAGHGALPHHHLSAHLLLPRLVRPGLRGPRAPLPPRGGRLCHPAVADPTPGAGVVGQRAR